VLGAPTRRTKYIAEVAIEVLNMLITVDGELILPEA
jgi:hypothetical protein